MESEEKQSSQGTPSVETLADDMVRAIEGTGGGVIKQIIQEEEKREIKKRQISIESRKNKFFILSGALLITLGVSLLIVLFFTRGSEVAPPLEVSEEARGLIAVDHIEVEEIGGEKKEQLPHIVFGVALSLPLKRGEIGAIRLTESGERLDFRRFLELIEAKVYLGEVSYAVEDFMIGVSNQSARSSFILLKVRSFQDIFEVIKSWEKNMLSDLAGFLGLSVAPENSYLFSKQFEDGFFINKNARVLHDNFGNKILSYVFLNDRFVVITRSDEAAAEVLARLSVGGARK